MTGNPPIRVNAEFRRDPTRTTTLRNRFMGEAGSRFRNLKGLIREAIVDLDVLALRGDLMAINRDDVDLPGRAFDFTSMPQKVGAFMRWLDKMERQEILEVSEGTPIEQSGRQAWTAKYIQSAYQKGVAHSAQQIRGAGATVEDSWVQGAFNRPIHADRIGIIYTRAYRELEGITQAVDQQISRELSQGLAEGINPNDMAKRLTDRVDKIGRTRARTLARTETINAHSDATLNSYTEAQVEGVEVIAEFSTAGDGRVCERCESLEGDTFSIDEARGLIPVHPQCRCAWKPSIDDARGTRLQ